MGDDYKDLKYIFCFIEYYWYFIIYFLEKRKNFSKNIMFTCILNTTKMHYNFELINCN